MQGHNLDIKKNSNGILAQKLNVWGGLECTLNRVANDYFSQMHRNGHDGRLCDLERFESLGISAIRYPVLWELIAPYGPDSADWSWTDARLPDLRARGITTIAGLMHHGSGPLHTSLIDSSFPEHLAVFAGAVAKRYPWIEYYTPVNEPLTTARFSGLYGAWYPHGHDDGVFIQALLNQCRAIVLSMRAIREINSNAKLIQTDDLSKTYSTPEMSDLADFYNERRWLSWDLLCGKVGPDHPLWKYLIGAGTDPSQILWFRKNTCPPEIIGVNYYITSERWLDHRVKRYSKHCLTNYQGYRFVDIEPARVLATPTPGIAPLLAEAWERYRLPLAVTEAHIGAHREDQLRWLLEIWESAKHSQQQGIDICAVTVWALLGSYDWNSLVTECKGYYEPGPFDVRFAIPRPTAIATLMRELALGSAPSHPVLKGHGWWRREGRFSCPPVATRTAVTSLHSARVKTGEEIVQPILITGATGTLGYAFARMCQQRNLAFIVLTRQQMDISVRVSVERAIAQYRPWAIVNASGYVNVDNAENDVERCFRENTIGPSILADICARDGIRLLTFSSDLVFNGEQRHPYVESDEIFPLNVYGRSKAKSEQEVLGRYADSLIVRTSAIFGPWDRYNFITQGLKALAEDRPFVSANDITVSPTYVPDLVHASLDLLIDGASGMWHLTNGQSTTWMDLILKAADKAGIDAGSLVPRSGDQLEYIAPRPPYSALSSERAILLPTLDDALDRYLHMVKDDAVDVRKSKKSALA
ncbi:MAG: sugar nucleotide-binding protein [Nitrosospira sp.]|nr:sugar nucleotide-binding protein [Nitrosospira sp.]